MFALVFDEEGPGDLLILAKPGLGTGEKFTLFGVVGMFILTNSSPISSISLEGISKIRFCRLRSELDEVSSLISVESSTCQTKAKKNK